MLWSQSIKRPLWKNKKNEIRAKAGKGRLTWLLRSSDKQFCDWRGDAKSLRKELQIWERHKIMFKWQRGMLRTSSWWWKRGGKIGNWWQWRRITNCGVEEKMRTCQKKIKVTQTRKQLQRIDAKFWSASPNFWQIWYLREHSRRLGIQYKPHKMVHSGRVLEMCRDPKSQQCERP